MVNDLRFADAVEQREAKERAAADARRLSTLDRMAGNIAAGFVVFIPPAKGADLDTALQEVAELSSKLARLIYEENRK